MRLRVTIGPAAFRLDWPWPTARRHTPRQRRLSGRQRRESLLRGNILRALCATPGKLDQAPVDFQPLFGAGASGRV